LKDHGAVDEVVQYLVFRGDVRLPKGKAAAQAGHAVQLAIRAIEQSGDEQAKRWLAEWEAGSYTKIAVRVADLVQLRDLATRLDSAHIIHVEVVDEGRTAIEPGTATVLGLQPVPKSLVSSIISAFPLY
jgi:peptidyl-tRNA hydrolase, PTH2 family